MKALCFSRTMADAHAALCQRAAAHWAAVARELASAEAGIRVGMRPSAAQTVAARWAALSRQSPVPPERIVRMRDHAGNPWGVDVVPIEYVASRRPVENVLHPSSKHIVHPCHARINAADAEMLAALGIDYVVCVLEH